jgi:single-strand DNA-binding protein
VSFAKAILSGVVDNEPEKRFTPNNHAVTNFNLIVEGGAGMSRPGGNETFEVKITCWRNLADAVAGRLQKGDHVLVEGKLIINSFQAQDGSQQKQYELEAVSLEKLAGPSEAIVPVSTSAAGTTPALGAWTPPATSSPQPSAAYQPRPAAPVSGFPSSSSGHFSSEDLLTEDDIPF